MQPPQWHPSTQQPLECHDCGLLHAMPCLPPGGTAYCGRCGAVLRRAVRNSLDQTLALGNGGLILYGLSNIHPVISLRI